MDGSLLAPAPLGPVQSAPRPRFSVVIAAWRAEDTIAGAVASALDQTERPVEVIVCDDGSPDGTGHVVEQFGNAVRLLTIPHGGEAAAKNAAVTASTGEFVVILDADDVWLPTRLERLADALERRPDLDVVTSNATFEVDGRPTTHFYKPSYAFPVENQRLEILRRNFVLGHAAVRRSRWHEAGGFDNRIRIGADWDFWLRLVFTGSLVGCVNEPLATYRLHHGSLSDDRLTSLWGRVELLERAAAREQLTGEERRVVAASIAQHRRRALLSTAEVSVANGQRTARRDAFAVLRTPDVGWRDRCSALAAVVAPGAVGRRLRRRYALTGRAGYERHLSRPP